MAVEPGSKPDQNLLPPELNELIFDHRFTIAAATGSFISTICGFPLDSVKSRLQVKRYSSVLDCVNKTYRHEGMSGFFRGVTIPLVTITAVRTASFSIYTGVKSSLTSHDMFSSNSLGSTAALGFTGGASSGMLLSIGTCAFELAKISQQLEYLISVKKGVPFAPKGTVRSFTELWRRGGFQSLYTGFRLHALRDTLGTGAYFSLYDTSRHFLRESESSIIPAALAPFVCGSTAGILSWAIIYPIDLVKSKVQRNALASEPAERPWRIFQRLSAGGVTRLYRGLGVSASRSLLTHGMMWSIWESVQSRIARGTGHADAIGE